MNALSREVTDDAEATSAYVRQDGPTDELKVEINFESVIQNFVLSMRDRIFMPLRNGVIFYENFSLQKPKTLEKVVEKKDVAGPDYEKDNVD